MILNDAFFRYLGIGAIAVSILSGCNGPYPMSSLITEKSSFAGHLRHASNESHRLTDFDAPTTGAVIVSVLNQVFVYTEIGKMIGEIGIEGAEGLALDASGNLYVANVGNGGHSPGVLVYKNDYKTLLTTLSDPYPSSSVAVDRTTGIVAVTNMPPSNEGNVTFYEPSQTTPCANVSFTNVIPFNFSTLDEKGNLYVTGRDSTGNFIIGLIRGGCSASALTLLSTSNSLGEDELGGVQVTPSGKIAIADQTRLVIYSYNAPVGNKLGAPIATTPLIGASAPTQFAFTKGGSDLFVADEVSSRVRKFAYPTGGNPLKYINTQGLYTNGLVITPPAKL